MKAAIRSRLLRLFTAIRSRKVPSLGLSLISVVGDRYRLPLGTDGLEVLPLGEAHGAGEDDGGEALYLGVVGLDRVVVVLAGKGDLVLRGRELLLEVEEHPVRAKLGVVLRH